MATSYESFYEGSPDPLAPTYGSIEGFSPTHFQFSSARLGFPGMPQTANQLGQAIEVIKSGVKAFEVTTLGLQGEDIVPTQHYDEMRALMKLSGVKPSLHGPLIDPAGFGERGWGGEEQRADHERRMWDAVQKAQMLTPKNEKYTVPIVFHASNAIGGREYRKEGDKIFLQKSLAVNRENGQITPLELEYKYRPELPESLDMSKPYEGHTKPGKPFTVEKQTESINNTMWENKLTELATFAKHSDELLAPVIAKDRFGAIPLNSGIYDKVIMDEQTGKLLKAEFAEGGKKIKFSEADLPAIKGDPEKESSYEQLKKADIFLENVELNFNSAFHQAYKYGTDEQRKDLKKLANQYSKEIKSIIPGEVLMPIKKQDILQRAVENLAAITMHKAPEVYQEVEDFSKDKSATTFGNLAFRSYENFTEKGKNAPMLAIENLPEHMAFNDAKQVRELIELSRKKFAERLVTEKRMDEKKAKKIAEQQIGATWDVGHTNTLKKRGFTDEDIIKETQIMTGTGKDKGKNIVKHVHLTDNFGFSDSHMALGQGNVPLSKIMQELKKTGQIDKMNKIIESGAFISQFRKSPLIPSLNAIASPIYSMKMGPSFNQIGAGLGNYIGGYGTINPEGHHSLYGAGFTALPMDLGGQMPNTGSSRFGGTPMA